MAHEQVLVFESTLENDKRLIRSHLLWAGAAILLLVFLVFVSGAFRLFSSFGQMMAVFGLLLLVGTVIAGAGGLLFWHRIKQSWGKWIAVDQAEKTIVFHGFKLIKGLGDVESAGEVTVPFGQVRRVIDVNLSGYPVSQLEVVTDVGRLIVDGTLTRFDELYGLLQELAEGRRRGKADFT